MPTIATSEIPPPSAWDEFESLILSTSKIRFNSTDFFGNGRPGQSQNGVDVWGTSSEGYLVGVQCKKTISQITVAIVRDEIEKAASFTPSLKTLYIATTARRDAPLQQAVRTISEERLACSKFAVYVLFWEDICNDLASNQQEFFKHYPQFEPKVNPATIHDQKLYLKIVSPFTASGVIEFLDETNMAGFPFEQSKLSPIWEFIRECGKPENEFIDQALETHRKALVESMKTYTHIVFEEVFSYDCRDGFVAVPAEWETQDPERFARAVESLHSAAERIVEQYGKLVRAARPT